MNPVTTIRSGELIAVYLLVNVSSLGKVILMLAPLAGRCRDPWPTESADTDRGSASDSGHPHTSRQLGSRLGSTLYVVPAASVYHLHRGRSSPRHPRRDRRRPRRACSTLPRAQLWTGAAPPVVLGGRDPRTAGARPRGTGPKRPDIPVRANRPNHRLPLPVLHRYQRC